MSMPVVRDDLVAVLEEALLMQQRLVADTRDEAVPVADLVAQVSVLERLDDRRDQLISQLRHTASAEIRGTRTSPPIREFVLETLAELRWPQNAGFLAEYLWARRQLQIDSRAFAPVRRDERRAWERAPEARTAYIAPALNTDGTANPRWITSSAWDLERRVVASAQTVRLLDLQKILSLAGRPGSADVHTRGSRGAADALLEHYASDILGTEPPPVSASSRELSAWRGRVREHASDLIAEIRRNNDPERRQIARQLAGLSEHERTWGREAAAKAGDRSRKRAR